MTPATHTPGFVKWSPISGAYFDPSDLSVIAQAQSILFSLVGHVSLSASQARDVIAWRQMQH
jgi:hypothetical protein